MRPRDPGFGLRHPQLPGAGPGVGELRHPERRACRAARRRPCYRMDFPARPPVACAIPAKLVEALGIASAGDPDVPGSDGGLRRSKTKSAPCNRNMDVLAEVEAFAVIVTAPAKEVDFVSRFFAPRGGIAEDPVTGSAHCTLVPYWSKRLEKRSLHAYQVSAPRRRVVVRGPRRPGDYQRKCRAISGGGHRCLIRIQIFLS